MARRKHTFEDGEIIFREGDDGDCAYEVLFGQVELLNQNGADSAPVRAGVMHVGQMFGEMGLVGGGPRESSARAIGPVKLRIIEGDLSSDPGREDIKTKKKSVLSRFIDQLGTPAASPSGNEAAGADGNKTTATSDGPGFIQRVMDRVQPLDGRIEARIAVLSGDPDGIFVKQIIQTFEKYREIHARPLSKALEINLDKDLNAELNRVAKTGRRWLRKSQADVLIWGHVPPGGTSMHLHFVPLATGDARTAGVFDLTTDLPLPAGIPGAFGDLLRATTLAATMPTTRDKARMRLAMLPESALASGAALAALPADLTSREKASLHLCHGNVLSAAWIATRATDLLDQGINAYQTTTSMVSAEESALDWAMAQRHLSTLLYARTEQTGDGNFDQSATAALSALEVLTREEMPYAWAALQHRLGLIHYKMGFENGHTGILRQALRCHQNALKVYNRKQTPDQWAETMSGFAQAAQVFGELVKSLEAMATAANACHAVLQIRDKNKAPLAWASTQNNLGSALFLLGKQANNPERLEAAIQAFEQALEVYQARNKHRHAAVTAKNLDRARYLLEMMAPEYAEPIETPHLEEPSGIGESQLVDLADIGAGRSGARAYD